MCKGGAVGGILIMCVIFGRILNVKYLSRGFVGAEWASVRL